MNYEEFLNEAKESLTERLSDGYPGISVEITEVEKLQNQSYRGLSIREAGKIVGMSVDLSPFFDRIQDGEDKRFVMESFFREVRNRMDERPAFDISRFQDYEAMRDTLSIQLVPVEGNEQVLQTVPHTRMEDLAAVYRFRMGDDGSVLIKNEMLSAYGITEAELKADAARIASEREPATIRSLAEVMAEMMPFGMEVPRQEPVIYVAATTAQTFGAGVLAYPGFHEMAAEQLNGDYFILPSSIHEVLLVPDDGKADWRGLEEMVQTINESTVLPDERLSDHVYHYDSKDRIFELASVHETRMAQKTMEQISGKEKGGRQHPAQEKNGQSYTRREDIGKKSVLEELKTGREESGKLHAEHAAERAAHRKSQRQEVR